MAQKYINNASTILNGNIAIDDLVLTVRTGDGAIFPSLASGEFFFLTLIEYDAQGSEIDWEIVKVTGKTTDTLTIVRGQENTVARAWLSGTRIENRFTAGSAGAFALDSAISVVGKSNNYNDLTNLPDLSVKLENISGFSTTDLAEGNNLYFSNARAVTAIKADAAWNANNWDLAYGWGDHGGQGYLTSFTETDPVFGASPAAGITATNITNWNTAHGWGDHGAEGYLTSVSWTDVSLKPATATRWPAWSEVTSKPTTFTPAAHDHDNATTAADGFMSSADKSKLNGIATGATANIGDITGVTAGNGLSGGGSSGSVSLALSTSQLNYASPVGTDELVFNNAGTPARYDFDDTPLSIFSNDLKLSNFPNDAGFITSFTNYYVSSASFSGATLSLGRSGLSTLTATMPAATSSASGVVSTSNQTWGGTKTASNFVASSDARLKENIISIDSTDLFNRIISLQPRLYTWKSTGEEDMGLIAQEVENFFPEYVHTSEQTGYKAVNYAKLTTALIGAVKELTERVKTLEEAS